MLFDPDSILSTPVSGAMSTRPITIPDGEYAAAIVSVRARQINRSDGSTGVVMDVTWRILDTSDLKDKNLANQLVRQSIFLDLTPEGALDLGPGKNIRLGRLREAVRQNDPGRPWAPSQLQGQIARIRVTHRVDESTGEVYNDVGQVAPL
mgnify:CR=1 FL=1